MIRSVQKRVPLFFLFLITLLLVFSAPSIAIPSRAESSSSPGLVGQYYNSPPPEDTPK